jgi:hypothetical protein
MNGSETTPGTRCKTQNDLIGPRAAVLMEFARSCEPGGRIGVAGGNDGGRLG